MLGVVTVVLLANVLRGSDIGCQGEGDTCWNQISNCGGGSAVCPCHCEFCEQCFAEFVANEGCIAIKAFNIPGAQAAAAKRANPACQQCTPANQMQLLQLLQSQCATVDDCNVINGNNDCLLPPPTLSPTMSPFCTVRKVTTGQRYTGTIKWLGKNKGYEGCWDAVQNDATCNAGLPFMYVDGGDKNCGCPTSEDSNTTRRNRVNLYACVTGVTNDLVTIAEGCFRFSNESDCVAHKDGRSWAMDQPCGWCCGQMCKEGNAALCQPKQWLHAQAPNANFKTGTGIDTCPETCCTGFTALCLSCELDISVYDYCVASPSTAGCECMAANNDWTCCSETNKCQADFGDCDHDSHCVSGTCVHDVGLAFGNTNGSFDVCGR